MSQAARQNAPQGHQGDDTANFCQRAEWLCRAVANRDLAGTPLYVVPQSRLLPEYGSATHCYGYTTPSLDLYLRDHISPWQGRGACIVINDLALAGDFHPDDLEYLTLAFALHELAHILDRPTLYEHRTGTTADRLLFETLVMADATKRPARADLPAYFGHEATFIRLALHLCHRAGQAGVCIGPGALCAGYRYGLSHAQRYQQALGDEPARRAAWLFRDISNTAPPSEFSSLWADDQAAYHRCSPIRGTYA